eukprot:m.487911 g.487911  ORF g.487911 m.487911 type:complete len:227 (-) comp25355_c0_seq1:142-822(-)
MGWFVWVAFALTALVVPGCGGSRDPASITDASFEHHDVRCKCVCPERTTARNVSSTRTSKLDDNSAKPAGGFKCNSSKLQYTAGRLHNLVGTETCTHCLDLEQPRTITACTYVTLVPDQEECFCSSVMPASNNHTQATKADCDLCSCTYESRNSNIIKGVIVVWFILLAVLIVVAAYNLRTPGEAELSVQDPDMSSVRRLRRTAPTSPQLSKLKARSRPSSIKVGW